MARTPNTPRPPVPMADILPEKAAAIEAAQDANALALQQAQSSAKTMAEQLGYDGSLTIGVLEDEIRFYQRRSVESLLECGKRLLLLRELTPHGEFSSRVELLGFSWRTANRFMQAAAKTSKFANLANLSTQVKNASAFLELVTHDEDDLKAIAEMDDLDRMSASQLRVALREARHLTNDAKADREAKDQVIARLKAQLNMEAPTPDKHAKKLLDAVQEAEATASAWVEGHLRKAIKAVLDYDKATDGNHNAILSGYIAHVEDATDRLREMFGLPRNLIESGDGDDPLGELPDDFLEQQGLVMPEPVNAKPKG